MEIVLSIFTGVLFGVGIYMILRRNLTKLVLGIIFLSNAANMIVFLSSDLHLGGIPFIQGENAKTSPVMSDPVPQALVLTAIVIGIATIAFTLVLKYKFHESTGTEDLKEGEIARRK